METSVETTKNLRTQKVHNYYLITLQRSDNPKALDTMKFYLFASSEKDAVRKANLRIVKQELLGYQVFNVQQAGYQPTLF